MEVCLVDCHMYKIFNIKILNKILTTNKTFTTLSKSLENSETRITTKDSPWIPLKGKGIQITNNLLNINEKSYERRLNNLKSNKKFDYVKDLSNSGYSMLENEDRTNYSFEQFLEDGYEGKLDSMLFHALFRIIVFNGLVYNLNFSEERLDSLFLKIINILERLDEENKILELDLNHLRNVHNSMNESLLKSFSEVFYQKIILLTYGANNLETKLSVGFIIKTKRDIIYFKFFIKRQLKQILNIFYNESYNNGNEEIPYKHFKAYRKRILHQSTSEQL